MNAAPTARARLGAVVAELWPRAPYEVRDAGGPGVIGFAYEAQSGQDAIASDRAQPFRRRANTLAWIPPGCPTYSTSPTGGEYLLLRGFSADAVAHRDAQGRTVNDAVDPAAVMAAQALRRWLIRARTRPEDPAAPLAAAEAVHVLQAALLQRFQGGPGRASGWLTPARLATIDRVITERMAQRIDVAALAATLGLSAGFFVLAFRSALGTTPHRYLMERRLARARVDLASTSKPISAIAADCGFADQAHLTRYMRKLLGTTPAEYRGWPQRLTTAAHFEPRAFRRLADG